MDRFPGLAKKYLLCYLVLLVALPPCAVAGGRLFQIKKVYVDSFGNGQAAAAMRKQLVDRLRESRRLEIVTHSEQADAVIKGTGQTWISGYVSLSRSHTVRSPVYQGFLSIQVIAKDQEALWSYLVTPSRLAWESVPRDMANQLASKLLAAIKEERPEGPSAGSAPEQAQGSLQGAGATFPAPLYQQWFQLFQERNPGVHISYEAVGSGEGIHRLQDGRIGFGASDMPLPDSSMTSDQKFIQLPTVLGAVVPIYNLEGVHEPLKFTPEMLAGIYLGRIKKWNDPQIRKFNHGAGLPDSEITVVHRSDGSGTTFVWTDYLSKVSPEWRSAAGSGVTVQWPAGIGAEHNAGIAATVQDHPGSIGYVELIYAIQHELSFGAVRNAAGRFIKADIASVAAAAGANSAAAGQDLRLSITDAPGTAAYPIASYTWVLLPAPPENPGKRSLVKHLLGWMLTSGQKSCSALGYVPLPQAVAKHTLEVLNSMY